MEEQQIVNLPKTKRGEATLERICLSAERSFYTKGYHNTSIVDITNDSKIALGTFYIYFKDKFSVYKYLLFRYSHRIRKAIDTETAGLKTRYEMERVGLKTFLEFIRDNKHAYNIIWESLYIERKLFVGYYDNFASRYILGITKAQDAGEMVNLDPMIMSYILMGVANFIGLKYVMFDDDDSTDIDLLVDQVMKILDTGMFNPKG